MTVKLQTGCRTKRINRHSNGAYCNLACLADKLLTACATALKSPLLHVACALQGYGNEVSIAADAKISAQRSADDASAANDSVKAFSPSAQLPDPPRGTGVDPRQAERLRPVRTLMPATTGSGPLPTPHAVPNQSPPAQPAVMTAAGLTASGGSSSSSGSSSAELGLSDGSSGSSSEVSYSHVTPYVEPAGNEGSSSGPATASTPLVGGGGGAGLPLTSRARQTRPAQRRGQDQV